MSDRRRAREAFAWSLAVVVVLGAALALAVPNLSGPVTRAAETPGAATVATARESAVLITASGCAVSSIGVGVVVEEGVITNAHVVAGATEVAIRTSDGQTLFGEVRAFDSARDLALIHVAQLDARALAPGIPAGGTEAVALVRGEDAVDVVPVAIERTINIFITDIYGEGRHQRAGLELAAEISEGDSGGGIVNGDGDLVGIVFSASLSAPHIAYAISAVELSDFVATRSSVRVDTGVCL